LGEKGGGIALVAQALLLIFLSHLWTLLKPFDGFRCNLAGRPTPVGSNNTQSHRLL